MGAPVPASLTNSLARTLAGSACRHREVIVEARQILTTAREAFAALAGLADSRAWEDEELWGCRAICDVMDDALHLGVAQVDDEATARRRLAKASRRRMAPGLAERIDESILRAHERFYRVSGGGFRRRCSPRLP